jgi:hypothetical protein
LGAIEPLSLSNEITAYHHLATLGETAPEGFVYRAFSRHHIDQARLELAQAGGLDQWLQRKGDAYRRGHSTPLQARTISAGHRLSHNLEDIISHGVHLEMPPTFTPNGGCSEDLAPQYVSNKHRVHHSMVGDVEAGRVIIIPWNDLSPTDKASVHVSKVTWAPKAGRHIGRICINLTSGSRRYPSLNHSIDMTRSRSRYPKPPPSDIRDVADAILMKKALHPLSELSLAQCDVSGAYTTMSMDAVSCKLQTVFLEVELAPGEPITRCLVFVLTNIFGNKIAGDAYGVAASVCKDLYDNQRGVGSFGSVMYVDDHTLVEPTTEIHRCLDVAASLPIAILGERAIDRSSGKVLVMGTRGDVIGFTCDLTQGTIGPKRKSLVKMFYLLFVVLPDNVCSEELHILVPTERLHSLTGLLQFFSTGVAASSGFLRALHSSIQHRRPLSLLNVSAKRSLGFWRALIFMAIQHEGGFERRIENMSRHLLPTRRLTTDACTSIGGGAHLAFWEGGSGRRAIVPGSDAEWGDLLRLNSATPSGRSAYPWNAALPHLFSIASPPLFTPNHDSTPPIQGYISVAQYSGALVGESAPRERTVDHGLCCEIGFIRWTCDELAMFQRCSVSINLLEYFVAALYLIGWVESLEGQVVEVVIDNTTAVSWFMKDRGGGAIAENLVIIMTMFCYKHGIITQPFHIAGFDNVFADRLSRDISLQEDDESASPPVSTSSRTTHSLRLSTARSILMTLSEWPSIMPLQNLLEIVDRLG